MPTWQGRPCLNGAALTFQLENSSGKVAHALSDHVQDPSPLHPKDQIILVKLKPIGTCDVGIARVHWQDQCLGIHLHRLPRITLTLPTVNSVMGADLGLTQVTQV